MAITQKFTLICDEVRREDSGKLILIGVYTPDIGLPGLPCLLPSLTFYQNLQSDRAGLWNIRMRLQHIETGNSVFEAMGSIAFQQPGFGINVIRLGNVNFTAAGAYRFIQEVEGQPDAIISHFSVVLVMPARPVEMPISSVN